MDISSGIIQECEDNRVDEYYEYVEKIIGEEDDLY